MWTTQNVNLSIPWILREIDWDSSVDNKNKTQNRSKNTVFKDVWYLPVKVRRSRLESRHTKYVGAIRNNSPSKYVEAKVEENAFFSNVLFIYFKTAKTDFVYLLRIQPKMRLKCSKELL